jgi:hypothetical protein
MRTLFNFLLTVGWFFRFGWECARRRFTLFLRSFTLMPGVLLTPYDESVIGISESMTDYLRGVPLGEADIARFKEHPTGYALMAVHQATLPLWFTPVRRLDVIARVAPAIQRHWSHRLGVDLEEAVDLFSQSPLD